MRRDEIPSFGKYVRELRLSKGISMLEVARYVGYGNPYWCDIELNRRDPPPLHVLEKLSEILKMTPEEYGIMMDFAGEGRDMAPPDLTGYILATPGVTAALRTAKDMDLQGDEWMELLEDLKKRKGLR